MSERFSTLTVVLERDIRDDDAQPLIDAISMLRGVISVRGDVADLVEFVAEQRAREELRKKVIDILY